MTGEAVAWHQATEAERLAIARELVALARARGADAGPLSRAAAAGLDVLPAGPARDLVAEAARLLSAGTVLSLAG